MAERDTDVIVADRPEHREDRHDGMRDLAHRLEAYHTAPYPDAVRLEVDPFPERVMNGLWIGILVGGVLGAIFGALLRNNTVAPRGWEGLYSMTPFTFVVFWTMVGVALGMLVIGVAFILATPPEEHDDADEAGMYEVEAEPARREEVVAED